MTQQIRIDRDKCIGCGQCANACPESAIEMVDGKAELTRPNHCDGLGACLGTCPVDAITFVEVEAAPAAPATAEAAPDRAGHPAGGCPFSQPMAVTPKETPATATKPATARLENWPVQLKLIQPGGPLFTGADVLIAADCTAAAYGAFQDGLLAGRRLIMACPKLDDRAGYVEKLTVLFRDAQPASVTVARMEVPCCAGIVRMVLEAREAAGSDLPVRVVTIGVHGDAIDEEVSRSDSKQAKRSA